MKLKKKARLSTIMTFIDIIMVLLIFYFASQFIDNATESTTFEKNYIAKDLPLFIDTLESLPGNIKAAYQQNTFWFSYDLEPNKVVIKAPGRKDVTGYMVSDTNIKLKKTSLMPDNGYKDEKGTFEKIFKAANPFAKTTYSLDKSQRVVPFFIKEDNSLKVIDSNEEENEAEFCVKNFNNYWLEDSQIFLNILDKGNLRYLANDVWFELKKYADEVRHNGYGYILDEDDIRDTSNFYTQIKQSDVIVVFSKADEINVRSYDGMLANYLACKIASQLDDIEYLEMNRIDDSLASLSIDYSGKAIVYVEIPDETDNTVRSKIKDAITDAFMEASNNVG